MLAAAENITKKVDISGLASTAFSLMKLIYDQVEIAKANQRQCQRLASRCREIESHITQLKKLPNTNKFETAMIRLVDTLQSGVSLTKKFTDEKWIVRFIKASGHETSFTELNLQLSEIVAELQLGLQVNQLFNQEEDRNDQAEDIKLLQAGQVEIAEQAKKILIAQQHLDIKRQADQDILLRQLASIRQHLLIKPNSSVSAKPELNPKYHIPYYQIQFENIIQKGSFGVVWKGILNEETVAIKVVNNSLDEVNMKQFLREVAIMSHLRNGHITRFYGAALEEDKACIVMEYMKKGSLKDFLANEPPLSILAQHKLALQILIGLNYLHINGYVHADLKSANVLINKHNEAKLADFGLSKSSSRSILTIDQKSSAFAWCAPELLGNNPQVSAASDMFAYGTILWEIITRKLPYANCTNKEIAENIMQGKRESLTNIPSHYIDIIQSCWSHSPNERPTAIDLIKKMKDITKLIKKMGEKSQARGMLYKEKKDEASALTEFQQAAQQGNPEALRQLGIFAVRGQGGMSQNKAQAYHYFEQAAKKGDVLSMYNLAQMVEHGDGVSQDLNQAKYWYELALKKQHPDASHRLQRVIDKIAANNSKHGLG